MPCSSRESRVREAQPKGMAAPKRGKPPPRLAPGMNRAPEITKYLPESSGSGRRASCNLAQVFVCLALVFLEPGPGVCVVGKAHPSDHWRRHRRLQVAGADPPPG